MTTCDSIYSSLSATENAANSLSGKLDTVLSILQRLENKVDSIDNRLGNVETTVNNLLNSIESIINSAIDNLSQNIRALLDNIFNLINNLIDLIRSIFGNEAGETCDLSSILQALGSVQSSIINSISSSESSIINKIDSAENNIITEIRKIDIDTSLLETISRQLTKCCQDILSAIADLNFPTIQEIEQAVRRQLDIIIPIIRNTIKGELDLVIEKLEIVIGNTENIDNYIRQINSIVTVIDSTTRETLVAVRTIDLDFDETNILNAISRNRNILNGISSTSSNILNVSNENRNLNSNILQEISTINISVTEINSISFKVENISNNINNISNGIDSLARCCQEVKQKVSEPSNEDINGTLLCSSGDSLTYSGTGVKGLENMISSLASYIKCELNVEVEGKLVCEDGSEINYSGTTVNTSKSVIDAMVKYLECSKPESECASEVRTYKETYPYDFHVSIDWYDTDKVTSRYPNTIIAGIEPELDWNDMWENSIKEFSFTKGNIHGYMPLRDYSTPVAAGNFSSKDEAARVFNFYKSWLNTATLNNLLLDSSNRPLRYSDGARKRNIKNRTLKIQRFLVVDTKSNQVLFCFKNRVKELE